MNAGFRDRDGLREPEGRRDPDGRRDPEGRNDAALQEPRLRPDGDTVTAIDRAPGHCATSSTEAPAFETIAPPLTAAA